MFKDYSQRRANTAKALADEAREEALLPATMVDHSHTFAIGDGLFTDKPFQFTSPKRVYVTEGFTDKELCELSDWIFGKPGAAK